MNVLSCVSGLVANWTGEYSSLVGRGGRSDGPDVGQRHMPLLLRVYQNGNLLAASLAVATHAYFSRAEPDFEVHMWLWIGAGTYVVSTWAVHSYAPDVSTVAQAVAATVVPALVFAGVLTASVVTHRLALHRLRRFPGPFWARVTKFHGVGMALRMRSRRFVWLEAMRTRYGDYVRTGPRELSVFDVAAVPVIHGVSSRCGKGPWYGAASHIEGFSLHTSRDKADHRERRREWDRALGAGALRDYEARVEGHTIELLDQLRARLGRTVSLSDWFSLYAFDVMGDVGFSRSFGMVAKGETDDALRSLHGSMEAVAVLGHVPWFGALVLRSRTVAGELRRFMDWTTHVLEERRKTTPAERDVFSWLVRPSAEDIPLSLNSDTRLMIVAGSDTTSAVLTWLFYELCRHPELLEELRDSVDSICPEKAFLSCQDVSSVPLLDSYITETLRLHPPVPSGVERETPPEGITIPPCHASGTTQATHIPGHTLVWTATQAMQTDERYFEQAAAFVPHRWLPADAPASRADTVRDRRAWMPFGTGRYDCVGRGLAMMEMRVAAANLLRSYDVGFAPGEDGSRMRDLTKDAFTLVLGGLDCVFTARTP